MPGRREASMKTTLVVRTDLRSRASIIRDALSPHGARGVRRPEHYYVGRTPRDTEIYVVSRAAIEPLEHHGYRSTAAFDWGAPTPGALEFAYAMLAHSTESRPPDPICEAFSEVVGCLDRAGFVLGHGEIALWLLTAFCEGNEPPPSPPRSLRYRCRKVRPAHR